ncbi:MULTISPECIES: CS1 type fimbrial major subunit [Pseudomonas]|uniref:Adhesin n=1 Tax=Pseudomonas tritici TaxID=2745518 RepID=A0A8H9YXL0_9PSED|nr:MULTISPECIES: CS1 type fimbrial major subunit [Pseudomonas]MBP2870581.1 adhesin [Pseudomonas sp. SWRI144]QXH85146.1 adhesin [Pseudomonas tritici]CRL99625.1 hypothetical protein [Pseudomonas sp. 24 R 17]CRM01766.1 hypothetical protein [Pseudomonas sp. 24 E 1]CRM15167.1 hypothetical protein [Pseudomonas sp. 52 E 6]
MFNRLTCAALAVACLQPLQAAVERETFEVFAEIPSQDFYVLPMDPQLVHRENPLHYNPVSSELSPLRAEYEVKNIGGSIEARLEQMPSLSNGTDRIDLQVRFNNQPLGLTSVEVVSAAEAKPGRRVALDIRAIKPDDDYRAGHYFGTVQMVFDAIAPRL